MRRPSLHRAHTRLSRLPRPQLDQGVVRDAHAAGRRLNGRLLTHALRRHAHYYHQDVLIVVDGLDGYSAEVQAPVGHAVGGTVGRRGG